MKILRMPKSQKRLKAGVDKDIDDNEFERDEHGENKIEVEENDV